MELSDEQIYALELFKQGNNLLISGPGGTGKSKLIRDFVYYAKENKKKIQITALTGCASLLLGLNAKTIHSWSGIRLCKGTNESIIEQACKNKNAKKNWKSVQILIIDEGSMMSRKMFDVLNAIAKKIRNDPRPFGNIQVIVTCDFYQLPPIETQGEQESGEFCFESPQYFDTFPLENHVLLTKIFRQNDPQYIEILNEVRKGKLTPPTIEILKKYVNRDYNIEENNGIYLTKLFPTRSRVDNLNNQMFDALEDSPKSYELTKSRNTLLYMESGKAIEKEKIDLCMCLQQRDIDNEINQLISSSPALEKLSLKINTMVMCNINLDMERKICNGSQGIVVDFVGPDNAPKVRFSNNVTIVMNKHVWQSETYPTISISQYPLQHAWALTIHKIQGTTLKVAQMDIGNSVFTYGQSYVALSRIESINGLYLSGFEPNRIKANPKVTAFYEKIPPIDTDKIQTLINANKQSNIFCDFELQEENYEKSIPDKDIKIIKLP